MATTPPQDVVHWADAFEALGPVELRRLFGGWSMATRGVMFAVVLRHTLYFRVIDEAMRKGLIELGSEPFTYKKRSHRKPTVIHKFYSAPVAWLDDTDALCAFARTLLSCRARSG